MSCNSHIAPKANQPSGERPRIEPSVQGLRPGAIATSSTTTATEASQVWMPYQAMPMTARIRAGMLAPKTPKETRAKTG